MHVYRWLWVEMYINDKMSFRLTVCSKLFMQEAVEST